MSEKRSAGWSKALKWTTNAALLIFLLITGFLLLHKDGAIAFGSLAYYLLALCLALLFGLRYLLGAISSRLDGGDASARGKGEHR